MLGKIYIQGFVLLFVSGRCIFVMVIPHLMATSFQATVIHHGPDMSMLIPHLSHNVQIQWGLLPANVHP